jgi:hypothetical protein
MVISKIAAKIAPVSAKLRQGRGEIVKFLQKSSKEIKTRVKRQMA